MAIQIPNLGTAPSGTGGDTSRSAMTKIINNFSTTTHAANRLVGTASGNVMEVGAFGLGGTSYSLGTLTTITQCGFGYGGNLLFGSAAHSYISARGTRSFILGAYLNRLAFTTRDVSGDYGTVYDCYTTGNTTVDSNGFIKKASPVVKLFADKIEANEEALEQNPIFEKVDVGHYLIKNTEGFAKESWWIEVPTDTNGNRICAVQYKTLENGDLEVKTYKKAFIDGEIVANLDHPIDIPNNSNNEPRWIDIRLHSTPKPIVHKVPRTEKQPRMVQQVKMSMQPTYMTKLTDLIDDNGEVVVVNGKPYQKKETYMVTDSQGIATLTNQITVDENGENVLEWVHAVDSEGKPIFDDVPVLDDDGNQLFDEVTYEPEQ